MQVRPYVRVAAKETPMMPYDPIHHHRQSTRYPGFDYTSTNAYSVTICTHARLCLFGEVLDGETIPAISA